MNNKFALSVFIFFSFNLAAFSSQKNLAESKNTFIVSLPEKPKSLNPHLIRASSVSLLYTQLYRNLLWVNESGGLQNDLAEKCERLTLKKYHCILRKNLHWSDGSRLTAEDIKLSYERFLNPKTQAPQADYLFPISGAIDFYKEVTKTVSGIKVEKKKDYESLIFELASADSEFLYRLASPVTAITSSVQHQYSGPFVLESDIKENSWLLKPNPFYHISNSNRPIIKINFVKEPSITLSLFNKKQLDFISRIPTLYLPKYKHSPTYFEQNLIRLDYNGFGKNLKSHFKNSEEDLEFRKNFSASLNYLDLQNIFYAAPRPGCFGYTSSELLLNEKLCYSFKKLSYTQYGNIKNLKFIFSSSGGEDHQRAAEWLQEQARKNLGLTLKIQSLDNQVFMQDFKKGLFLFRRSLTTLTPTCLSLLENFKEKHLEYLPAFADTTFSKNIEKMKNSADEKAKSILCEETLLSILDQHVLIPLGPMKFPYLVQTNWTGIKSNPLFYFDFSGLKKN